MKTILLSLLYSIMARYIGGGVMRRLTTLVESAAEDDVPGAVKRQRVIAALADEVRTFGTVAINAAVEVALLKLRADGRA
jgi:hypothetical protein